MDKYIDMMGHKFSDLVTGFEGIAESVSFDLYGCIQIALRPPQKKDGTCPEGRWFDATRLKKLSSKRIMEVPTFVRLQPAPGPADKASILR